MSERTSLDAFSVPKIDVERLPPSEFDAPESLYTSITQESVELAKALVSHIPTHYTEAGYILEFSKATYDDYVNAIEENPTVVIQGLTSTCHMSERIVREHVGVPGLFAYEREDLSVSDTPGVQDFITNGLTEYLTYDVPVETVIHLYYRQQEQYRSYQEGKRFHDEVRDHLEDCEFAVERGYQHPGCPNFLVNKEPPIEFTGNAVVGKALDPLSTNLPKRARYAADRLEKMKETESQVTVALVFRVRNPSFPNERIKEHNRELILQQHPDMIDGVFFDDELDELSSFCNNNIEFFDYSPHNPSDEETSHESLDSWGA